MSKRQALGRHRATPVRTNPLESISKAVASNAGSVGRQAAVIAAASGLVLTLGVPAQGAPAVREAAQAPADVATNANAAGNVTVAAVKVSAKAEADLDIERPEIVSAPAPEPEPEPEPVVVSTSNEVEAEAEESESVEPVTRETRTATVEAAPEPEPEAAPVSAGLSGIAAIAAQYEGVPYVWGGETPAGWDCSGFVKYVYNQAGIDVARGTSALLASGDFVRTSNPQPGDLVFQNGGGHVGIYLGGGRMIGAQNPSVDTFSHDVTRNPLYGYYTYAG